MSASDDDLEARIRARAYELWEQEGRPEGRDREHWAQAAREIAGESDAGGEAAPAGRDFGDSAGYGGGGSALDRHDVGDVDLAEDRKHNPLDEVMTTGAERKSA